MAVVQNGMRFYWNAKSGLTSGNLANLTPGGAAVPAVISGGVYDSTNGRVTMDGIDDTITVAGQSMFAAKAAFTFEMIFEFNGTPPATTYQEIFGGSSYNAYADIYRTGTEYEIFYYLYPGTGVSGASDTLFAANEMATQQKIHLVIAHESGGTTRAYINGRLASSKSDGNAGLMGAVGDLVFAGNKNEDSPAIHFHAARFYDRALTTQEVADNVANGAEIGLTASPVSVTGAASMTASASAAATGRKVQTAVAAMATSGSMTSGGRTTRLGTTALIATAQSSAAGTTVSGVIAGATIGAVSTIGTTSVRVTDAGASMNGAALLTTTAVAIIDVRAEATLTGESSSAQSVIATREGTAPLSAESSAAAAGQTVFSAAAALTVATSTTATPEVGFNAASTLAAAAEIGSQPIAHREDGAMMAGASTLDVNAISGTEVSAVIAAESSGSASAIRILTDASTAASSAILATDSVITREDTAELTAAAEMLATPERTQTFEATLAGAGGSLQDGIRIVNVSSQIATSGTVETDPAILHAASAALDAAADISAASETVAVTEMSAALTGSSSLTAASQKATSGSALLDIHSLTNMTGVRITPTESDLTATSGTDAAEPVRLAIASADMDAATQAEAIASVIVAFIVTASGSAELAAGMETTTSAAAALMASANLDVDYAPGYIAKAYAQGTADTRDTVTAAVERVRVTGRLIRSVRTYGVITRKEGV